MHLTCFHVKVISAPWSGESTRFSDRHGQFISWHNLLLTLYLCNCLLIYQVCTFLGTKSCIKLKFKFEFTFLLKKNKCKFKIPSYINHYITSCNSTQIYPQGPREVSQVGYQKGSLTHQFPHILPNNLEIFYNFLGHEADLVRVFSCCEGDLWHMVFVKHTVRYCLKFLCGAFTDTLLDLLRALCKELCNVENPNWDWQEICWFHTLTTRHGCIAGSD